MMRRSTGLAGKSTSSWCVDDTTRNEWTPVISGSLRVSLGSERERRNVERKEGRATPGLCSSVCMRLGKEEGGVSGRTGDGGLRDLHFEEVQRMRTACRHCAKSRSAHAATRGKGHVLLAATPYARCLSTNAISAISADLPPNLSAR